mmetsp:Transcript_17332/g.40867  ORF Transcript_17332/g.40867 Transcript_17332/m.40867 type:complete len:197 (+) Transcript_17332:28-618(+)
MKTPFNVAHKLTILKTNTSFPFFPTMTTSSTSPAINVKGHCYCGAVEYQVILEQGEKPIFPPCYCHCDSCRRAQAAPLYHVVCIDGGKHFAITKGQELIQKYQKPISPKSGLLTRCFCRECGTRILNEFDPNLDFWPEGTTQPMVFFPNTLEEDVASNLPEAFRAQLHYNAESCVLDFGLLSKLTTAASSEKEAEK